MYNLIIFTILTPLFHVLLYRKWLGIIALIVFGILPVFATDFLYVNLYSVIFYFLGYYIDRYHLGFFTKTPQKNLTLLATLVTVIVLIIKNLSIYQLIQLDVITSQILLVILVLSLWFALDLLFSYRKIPKFTAEFFPVYTIHAYIIAILVKLIYLGLPQTDWALLFNEIASSILTLVITTTLVYWWHQKLPRTYKFLFGAK